MSMFHAFLGRGPTANSGSLDIAFVFFNRLSLALVGKTAIAVSRLFHTLLVTSHTGDASSLSSQEKCPLLIEGTWPSSQ